MNDRIRGPWFVCGLILIALLLSGGGATAAPGLCLGPVCADEIHRSGDHEWQLRLRVTDQLGHRERIVVDCRHGEISPALGPVQRGYARAVARRCCRLAASGTDPVRPVAPE